MVQGRARREPRLSPWRAQRGAAVSRAGTASPRIPLRHREPSPPYILQLSPRKIAVPRPSSIRRGTNLNRPIFKSFLTVAGKWRWKACSRLTHLLFLYPFGSSKLDQDMYNAIKSHQILQPLGSTFAARFSTSSLSPGAAHGLIGRNRSYRGAPDRLANLKRGSFRGIQNILGSPYSPYSSNSSIDGRVSPSPSFATSTHEVSVSVDK